MNSTVLSIFLTFTAVIGTAQTPLQQAFNRLQTGTELPEELLSTRSAVFLKISETNTTAQQNEAQILQELHKNLVALHIDAVAYFRWQDLNAGFDATGSYLTAIRDREINQIIVLSVEQDQFQLHLCPVGEDPGLFNTDIQVWHTSGNTLETVLETLSSTVRRAGLERANFLIAESPEIFVDTEIFTKNRFESFQPDLKLDKLAAPLFSGEDTDSISDPRDLELSTILRHQYPFDYETVSAAMTEELMRKAGFHYVLRYLNGEESTLMTLLDYTDSPSDPNRIAYKFYVKHLLTGDIYLGNTWDSQSTWQSALTVHLQNLKKSLKVEN